jgi:proteasome lid subunit RPN8/RPN11
MLQLYSEYLEQIRAEALEAYPEEGAWLITEQGCRRVPNNAPDPTKYFDVAKSDIRRAQSEGLLAVVHSHVNGNAFPSEMDMQGQINTDVPWGLLTCDGLNSSGITWWGGKGKENTADLLNRTFCHGVTDCYALLRDYYDQVFNIQLPGMPREWSWWEKNPTFMKDNLDKVGFSVVRSDPQPGDVWLASIGVRNGELTHCGILLENGLTHHHPGSGLPVSTRKAVIEPIYRYMSMITMWVRHKDRA